MEIKQHYLLHGHLIILSRLNKYKNQTIVATDLRHTGQPFIHSSVSPTMPSVSSSSLFHPAASCVRKYTESIVIGSQQQTPAPTPTRQQPQQQQQHADADTDIAVVQHEVSSSSPLPHPPRVVVCDFVLKIPTQAIRIDMTILVSTNEQADQQQPQPPPRPSVAYKITICTPARRCRLPQQEHYPHGPEGTAPAAASTPTSSMMTTVTWSSKFTVAPDVAASVDPFYEWTGSFDLNNTSRTAAAVPLDECSFYQVEGKFLANYAEDTTTAAVAAAPVADDVSSRNQSSTSRSSRTDTVGCGGDDEASMVPSRKKQRRCFETNNHNNDDAFLTPQTPQQQSSPLLAGI